MEIISRINLRPQLRRQQALVIAAVIAVVFLLTSILLLSNAHEASKAGLERLGFASNTLGQALDREVAGAHSLLLGLSSSPALRTDDLRQFYEQLKLTPLLDGTWLVLSDKEKLLLHSFMPFGTKLANLSEFTPQPAFFERLDKYVFALTGRVKGIHINTVAVTANLKIPDARGDLKYFITTVLSDKRFLKILEQQQNPPGVTAEIFDHNLNGIVSLKGDIATVAPATPQGLAEALANPSSPTGMRGSIWTVDAEGIPIVLAFSRSAYTGWTVATAIPLTEQDAHIRETLQQLAIAAIMLALGGIVALNYLKRKAEAPIALLESSVVEAEQEVGALSERLLQVQEDEHQRIAGELHDSTAQHLAGAVLGLMSLDPKLSADQSTRSAVGEIKRSIEQALNELRTFSYLLYPRDLGQRGLSAALEDFVAGFAKRAGLSGEATIDPAIDTMDPNLQRSLQRITQEALSNAHRHAQATRVSVKIAVDPDIISLEIRDDGHGLRNHVSNALEDTDGVGIPSMRRRLLPFGGALEIASTPEGTTVRAIIPRSAAVSGQA